MLGAEELTTAKLPDVPSATMYWHVAALPQDGNLEVVHERPVRGTVERSYRVRQDEALVDAEARAITTKGDHRKAFTDFAAALMADFDRYLSCDDAEPAREDVLATGRARYG
ncbi:hypothetical protein [Streptomyces celluloflavus]|uniref:hypothetical protein n=1 Tax=Streptomyces celluloflavus TaxID=58344 RepID=UPI003680F9E3